MFIKVNHEFNKDIMYFLWVNYDVLGNEEELCDTLVIDLICKEGIYKLEDYLFEVHDEGIKVPDDMKFIEEN